MAVLHLPDFVLKFSSLERFDIEISEYFFKFSTLVRKKNIVITFMFYYWFASSSLWHVCSHFLDANFIFVLYVWVLSRTSVISNYSHPSEQYLFTFKYQFDACSIYAYFFHTFFLGVMKGLATLTCVQGLLLALYFKN